jgi:tetratricopeptide (TPR) repeat protein
MCMSQNDRILKPEDYLEPNCPLCGDKPGTLPEYSPIPQRRVIEKMDEYMAKRDYAGAERHLLYWLEEAKLAGDLRGQLMLRNELIGHYRKVSDRQKALENAEEAVSLLDRLGFEGTISSGTTYTNIATALNAFGENEKSLEYFRKAKQVYESSPNTEPSLLGGLYNNMGLTCASLARYEEAYDLFDRAMKVMGTVDGGAAEQAVTCLNIAETIEHDKGMEQGETEIFALLDRALELLDSRDLPHDGYYAFVCEKCAPAFAYYGYFLAADDLTKRAEVIYEGN